MRCGIRLHPPLTEGGADLARGTRVYVARPCDDRPFRNLASATHQGVKPPAARTAGDRADVGVGTDPWRKCALLHRPASSDALAYRTRSGHAATQAATR